MLFNISILKIRLSLSSFSCWILREDQNPKKHNLMKRKGSGEEGSFVKLKGRRKMAGSNERLSSGGVSGGFRISYLGASSIFLFLISDL